MKSIPAAPEVIENLSKALANCSLFQGSAPSLLKEVASKATLVQAQSAELLAEEGKIADAFYVILNGKASALLRRDAKRGDQEVAILVPGDTFGDAAVLLGEPFGVSVKAMGTVVAARFDASVFGELSSRVPEFGLAVAKSLARRLQKAMRQMPIPDYRQDAPVPAAEVIAMLPADFRRHHRVLPLEVDGTTLTLGFVDAPSTAVLDSVRSQLPGVEIRPVRIDAAFFDSAIAAVAPPAGKASTHEASVSSIEPLLLDMVREGASDLHLSAGQRPKWRIDGIVREVAGAPLLGSDTAFELVAPLVDERYGRKFRESNDVDFSYRLANGERFRVNLFRDTNGSGAVLRHIPSRIPTLESLGMPEVVRRFCAEPKGLVLVTGPTGSGKSTTLAAMVDLINETREDHILTLEDPVEFIHPSKRSHVNQREVGSHTKSFAQALRAALREDPDVVLVGEMRDQETVSLALETSNTGHLVLATLHTSTAPMTMARIVSMFPPEEQEQIRSTLSDVLRGVICQNLCRRIGGGRVAALEIMVVNAGIANLIREAKTSQIPSMMQTGKAQGNVQLNESLATLVKAGKVEAAEAMTKAVDKGDLSRRLGIPAEAAPKA